MLFEYIRILQMPSATTKHAQMYQINAIREQLPFRYRMQFFQVNFRIFAVDRKTFHSKCMSCGGEGCGPFLKMCLSSSASVNGSRTDIWGMVDKNG